jgi:peptidoglycan hydrolase-like protein with peptidoglycan-binding domain
MLQYGSYGPAVAELQRDMNRIFRGYPMMPLAVDGDFGPRTKLAVQEFQRRVGLEDDGIVGPLTWAKFNIYGVKL